MSPAACCQPPAADTCRLALPRADAPILPGQMLCLQAPLGAGVTDSAGHAVPAGAGFLKGGQVCTPGDCQLAISGDLSDYYTWEAASGLW